MVVVVVVVVVESSFFGKRTTLFNEAIGEAAAEGDFALTLFS